MKGVYVHIESPAPRPISEEEVELLLEMLPMKLIRAINELDSDEKTGAGLTAEE